MVRRFTQSKNFTKSVDKLDNFEFSRLQNLLRKIIENPNVGKPMRYQRKGTRELYMKPFRLSYLYNSQEDVIIFLELYHKKHQ
jgi:mRNA-degrading endonuclease RelE of RelBE toxin-antitoxin system